MTTREREQNLCHNKQENVLIIGVDSQIGIALKNYLTTKKITVFGTTRKKENTNLNTYYFDLEKPDFEIFTKKFSSVVVCAATTNIAECEKDPQKHQAINVTNTIKTIEKLAQNNSFVIYLSSNAVFDGEKAFYKNNDKTCPTTLYGKFKTEVEEYLTTKLENNSCVLRLTKVITKNTPFIERWKSEASAGKSIRTFTNRFLSPVDIENVVDNIQVLIEQKRTGIYQYGGSEEISYTEYAKRYFQNDKSALELISAETENTKNKITYNSLSTHLPTKEAQYNDLLEVERVTMGLMSGHAYLGDSKRLAFTLSRYKFVSKMFSGFNNVLEVGCADAFGTPIVSNEVKHLVACDFDSLFIDDAKRNHPFNKKINFQVHNIVESPMNEKFEGIFSLDVLEHIDKKNEDKFMRNICSSLSKNGTCIIGMPSLESQVYASDISKLGHVNCKKGSELKLFLTQYFERVFTFSMNDEVVHTGFQPMSQYLLALCCFPIK